MYCFHNLLIFLVSNVYNNKMNEGKYVKKEQQIPTDEKAPTSLRNTFFSAVSQRLKSTRLGDLLLASGLITQKNLDHALSQQKETGQQIGRILIDLGAISPIKLYQKLAEQWCIKASTAGITLFMSTMTYAPSARAAEVSHEISFSSAVTSTQDTLSDMKYPALFGTREFQSNDVSAFKKWTGMLNRFEDQLYARSSTPRIKMWKTTLHRLENKSDKEKITAVNDYINQTRYVTDSRNWNKSDYWATPIEFFSKGGDCEDFAIAKYASLRALGISHEQMRIAIVDDKRKGIKHAILVVYTDEGSFVLDNQDKNVRALKTVSRYKPIFSINKDSWWLHKA